jgi:putative Ca2+/H+ antiporter (TMEM165/GDT1 family)
VHWKLFATVFATIFLAELGDKTQLATFLYAAERENPKLVVFAGAALALVLASALGVAAGAFLAAHIPPRVLSWVAGVGFIGVGVWTLTQAARAA